MVPLFLAIMKKILLILGLLTLVGCGGAPEEEASTFAFIDDYGRDVTVPLEARRIVSVSPAVTEIVYALGAGDRLVGRTDYCNYPEAADTLPSIGGISNLNVEAIIRLKPDLVICGSMVQKKTSDQLAKLGIPMACVTEKKQYDGLYDNIAKIGQLVGCKTQSDSLIGRLRMQLSQIDTMGKYNYGPNEQVPLPTVYYVVGFGKGGDYTAGGNTFINDIIRFAGGRNLAEFVSGWNFSKEKLLEAQPSYILIRQEDAETFCNTPPYNSLMAVRIGHVIPIESGIIDQQVPRNIEAIRLISDAINQ